MEIRIKLIAPVPVPPQGMGTVERMLQARRRAASPGTVIDFVSLQDGPLSLGSMTDRFLSAQAVYPHVVKAPGEGYNAVIVDCTCDQLYPEAVENLSIPLVPPLHASLYMAAMLCNRFSIITPTRGQGKLYSRLVEQYGFGERVISVRERALDFISGGAAQEDLLSVLLKEGQAALHEGAQVIILGCTALTQDRLLQEILGVPVLAPGDVAVKTAETLVQLGLRYT
ncbi:MAG: aspartate/glutamate racemase family protein [Bacillota bacterium]